MTSSLLIVCLLGLGSSVITEIIAWVNALLNGTGLTSLKGKGAFLVAMVISFVVALGQATASGQFSWSHLGADWSMIFAASQVIFVFIVEWLGITVPSLPDSATPSA